MCPIAMLLCPIAIKYVKCEIFALRVRPVVTISLTEALAALLNAQALNASTKRYYKTLPLMGATRLASGIKAKAHRQKCN